MKENIQGYCFSILFLIISSLLVSALISFLYMMNWMIDWFDWIYMIIEMILFAMSGFVLGYYIKQKALILSGSCMIVYMILVLILFKINFDDMLIMVIKGILYCLFTRISMKLKRN